jgi:hypothetical protein
MYDILFFVAAIPGYNNLFLKNSVDNLNADLLVTLLTEIYLVKISCMREKAKSLVSILSS